MDEILSTLTLRSEGALELARQLVTGIQGKRLIAGMKLPSERDLSTEYGISRGTVRRVLSELQQLGLVESAVGSGTFVSGQADVLLRQVITLPAIHVSPAKLMEARQLIEPLMPALIVRNATAIDFERMNECARQSECASTIEDFEYWDGELHKTLAIATHNPFFILALELSNKVREQSDWGSLKKNSLTPERREQYERHHRQIVAALIDRDAETAESALRAHLAQVASNLFNPA